MGSQEDYCNTIFSIKNVLQKTADKEIQKPNILLFLDFFLCPLH